ncbi:FHA domain-containing protein [Kitasatospora sp. NPDC056327]|uniref:FHA domain-containing protein n=1 Tax=Kitasatospora sp. NPDC056327 TaxID=3345785 RepID=UPI0035E0E844
MPEHQDLPRLIIDSPEPLRGRVYELAGQPLLVGRDDECQIRVGDPGISRRHAVVRRSDGHTTVEDLASTNGTRLNGHRVFGQQVLHTGDVIDVGPVELHYEEPHRAATTVLADPGTADSEARTETVGPAEDARPGGAAQAAPGPAPDAAPGGPPRDGGRSRVTGMAAAAEAWSGVSRTAEPPPFPPRPPGPPAPAPPPPPPRPDRADRPASAGRSEPSARSARRFDVGYQAAAGNLSNVAGDQYYNQYTYVTNDQRREVFFRRITAWQTRARHLVATGFVLLLLGSGLSGWALNRLSGDVDQPGLSDLTGVKFGGVPIGGIGFTMATAGLVLFFAGVTVYVVSAVRVRRFERSGGRTPPSQHRAQSRA